MTPLGGPIDTNPEAGAAFASAAAEYGIPNAGQFNGLGHVQAVVASLLDERILPTLSINDPRFGASPSASGAVNAAAIQRAIDTAVVLGGARIIGDPGEYEVTRTVTVDLPFPISAAGYQPAVLPVAATFYALNPTSIHFDMPGVTLRSTETGDVNDAVFLFDGARDCWFGISRIESTCVVNPTTGVLEVTGRSAIELHSTARDSFNNTILPFTADSCFAAVYIAGVTLGSYRVRGTTIGPVNLENGYRGLMLFDNGDDTDFVIIAEKATRLFFIFGVDGVRGYAHNREQLGGFQALIKAYDRDTRNIDITYRTVNANVGSARLGFTSEHNVAAQPTPAVIRNVHVHYDDTGSGHPAPAILFNYLIDGVEEATSAVTLFDNIHITGTIADSTITTTVVQTPAGQLSLEGLIASGGASSIPDGSIYDGGSFFLLMQLPNNVGFRLMRAVPNQLSRAGFWFATTSDNVQMGADVGHLQLLAPTGKKVQLVVNGVVKGNFSVNGLELLSLTAAQRDALTGVVEGTVIFNTDTNKLNFYTGAAWEAVTSA